MAVAKKSSKKLLVETESLKKLALGKLPRVNGRQVLIILFVLAVLALVLWRNKSSFVVALVDNLPVTRFQLEDRLIARYGPETLDELINEHLIFQEGRKRGVLVSDADVDAKIEEIKKALGEEISLEDALANQRMSMDQFRWQVRLQLTLEKMAAASLVVTDEEVKEFVASNSATMTATDEAGLQEEAREILTSEKKNTILRQLFTDLKNKANVIKFL